MDHIVVKYLKKLPTDLYQTADLGRHCLLRSPCPKILGNNDSHFKPLCNIKGYMYIQCSLVDVEDIRITNMSGVIYTPLHPTFV